MLHPKNYSITSHLLVTLAFSSLCTSCYFYSGDEREAFCRDKLYSSSEYENLKTYKQCMQDAGRLMYEYEQQKKQQEEQAIENRILHEKQSALYQAELGRKNREIARRYTLAQEAKARKERAEQLLENQRAQEAEAAEDAIWKKFSD